MTATSIRRARATRARALVVLGALALTLTAACSGAAEPEPSSSAVTDVASIDADKQPVPKPSLPATWPLTGVAVTGDEEEVNRPSLAVKIENTSAARPQTGLEDADVVWETIVEFQVARFIAVFHSKVPDTIGPIRSVRPMDPLILQPTHGLLAFSGGQGGIVASVRGSGLQALSNDEGVAGMYRSSERPAPHNVYGDTETLFGLADDSHQDAPGEQFLFARTTAEAAAIADGKSASTLAFRLSSASYPTWTWDKASGTWLRSEGTTPAVAASGDRLSAVNVVSIVADHPDTDYPAQGGARVPTYDLVGTGEGTIASGGKTIAVTWEKKAANAPLRLYLEDGSDALLAPGNTWVELIPNGSGSLTIS